MLRKMSFTLCIQNLFMFPDCEPPKMNTPSGPVCSSQSTQPSVSDL